MRDWYTVPTIYGGRTLSLRKRIRLGVDLETTRYRWIGSVHAHTNRTSNERDSRLNGSGDRRGDTMGRGLRRTTRNRQEGTR